MENCFVFWGKAPKFLWAKLLSALGVQGKGDGEGEGRKAEVVGHRTAVGARQTWAGIPECARADPGQVIPPFSSWSFSFVNVGKLPTSEDSFKKITSLLDLAQSLAHHTWLTTWRTSHLETVIYLFQISLQSPTFLPVGLVHLSLYSWNEKGTARMLPVLVRMYSGDDGCTYV